MTLKDIGLASVCWNTSLQGYGVQNQNQKNLRNQRFFAKAVMMFKILNGQTPEINSSFVMILLLID